MILEGRKWPLFEKSGAETFFKLGLWRRSQHGLISPQANPV
jgi:hypothetical protein